MTLGARVRERMEELGVNQTQLAAAVGVSQPAIHAILTKNKTGSRRLHKLALALSTTPAYLEGEIDDPDAGAPPPLPEPQVVHVMLPVALPAESALARMYQGILRSLGEWRSMSEDELAHELATLLPTGLGVVRGPLRYETTADDDHSPARLGAPDAGDRARRRA